MIRRTALKALISLSALSFLLINNPQKSYAGSGVVGRCQVVAQAEMTLVEATRQAGAVISGGGSSSGGSSSSRAVAHRQAAVAHRQAAVAHRQAVGGHRPLIVRWFVTQLTIWTRRLLERKPLKRYQQSE